MEEMVDFLQRFIFNLMLLAAPIVTAMLMAWLRLQQKKVEAQLEAWKPKLYDDLREAVHIAVLAAEQAGAAGLIENKKQYAMNIAQLWLDEQGWDEIDFDLLESTIEAAVLDL